MEINFNEIIILLIVFAPFFIVAIISYYAVNTSFFQTELEREIKNENIFYLDKIFGKYTDVFLKTILVITLFVIINNSLIIQDSFILLTIWLSFYCFRLTYKRLKLLEQLTWEEYADHKDKYNQVKKDYSRESKKFRIKYPTPDLKEADLKSEPNIKDSEMIFCFKLFHSLNYKDKTKNWNDFRNIILSNNSWKRKRSLLLKTSMKFASDELYQMWESKWGIPNLNSKIIWDDLKSLKNFDDFAQKWHFYALLISRNTIQTVNKKLFNPIIHFGVIIVVGVIYYVLVRNATIDIQLEANIYLSSLLFGISILFSVIYSVLALMLFVYGKVITIDDFNLPLPKLGEPFFSETSGVAIILSISTAVTVGLGIPLTLTLNFASSISIVGAVLAGVITAFIFFLSVWGTHFSMENTKERVLKELTEEINNEINIVNLEILKIKYSQVNSIPEWPVKIWVYLNILAAILIPIFLDKMIDNLSFLF